MLNTKNFIKMSQDKKESIYGGFAWAIALLFASQAVAQIISSIKMATSDNGSYKQKDFESHWDNKTSSSKSSSETKITNLFYAY